PPAARAAERPGRGRHESWRYAQASAAGIAEREYRAARGRGCIGLGPQQRLDVTGVDIDHREVEVRIRSENPALLLVTVGECDRRFVVAEVMSAGEHTSGREDDPRPDAPAAPDPDNGWARALPGCLDGGL